MTTILQISDTHIVPKGKLVSDRLETGAHLQRLVQRITDIREQTGPIDAVLVSGDISDDGSQESYARFKQITAPLDLPLFVIPGNHDARTSMRDAFKSDGYLPSDGNLNWYRQLGDVHLIGLDTLVEGEGAGTLDASSLTFISDTLAKTGKGPVLLALHHPPFSTGIGFMDEIGLKDASPLRDILAAYDGELRIVCGHIHCMMVSSVGPHVAISAPSPCSSFAFDTRKDAPVGFLDMADGCLIHKWQDGFQTIRIGINSGAGPFPF
jgi:3',5'-cyclic AMP phosphodiesterase CpdA